MISKINSYYADSEFHSIVAVIDGITYQSNLLVCAGSNVFVVFSDDDIVKSSNTEGLVERETIIKKVRENGRMISIDII